MGLQVMAACQPFYWMDMPMASPISRFIFNHLAAIDIVFLLIGLGLFRINRLASFAVLSVPQIMMCQMLQTSTLNCLAIAHTHV